VVARLRDTLVSGRHASRVLVLASRQNELLLGLDFFERLDAEIKIRDRETRSPTRVRYPEEFAAAIILILRRFAANSQSRIPD
jgi:hypothetical protein